MNLRTALVVALLGTLVPAATRADDLRELLDAGRLIATVSVDTPEPYLQRTPLMLAIEIATPRWFSRGTRVRDFHVPGAFVRPVSNFANNQSRRIDGETWSVQRWRYRIFVERPGVLALPELRVFISVNSESRGIVEGELRLAAPQFLVEEPVGAPADSVWLAAQSLEANERWEGEHDGLAPGDALTRIRRFEVRDAPAMIIPASIAPQIEGLSVYQAPATVVDQQSRGALSGLREERTVFTLQEPGTFQIEGRELAWYNTQTRDFETVRLPAKTIVVGGAAKTADTQRAPSSFNRVAIAVATLALLLAVVLIRTGARNLRRSRLASEVALQTLRWRQRRDYLRAVGSGDAQRCVALLYERLAETEGLLLRRRFENDPDHLAIYDQLIRHTFGHDALPEENALRALWQIHDRPRKPASQSRLALNPRPSV